MTIGGVGDLEKIDFGKSLIGVELREKGRREFRHSEFRQLFQ